ncbi:MAG: NACHT domain-containing protein, partial [Chloroflexota bacterium]
MTNSTKIDINQITNTQGLAIAEKVEQNNYFNQENKPNPAALEATARATYLNWLIQQHEYLDPRGTQQVQRQVQLKLDQIYIGLRAQADMNPGNDGDRKLWERECMELEMRLEIEGVSAEDREERLDALFIQFEGKHRREEKQNSSVSDKPIPLAQATDKHDRLVILGDPGSGKTTLMRYLTHQHAQAMHTGNVQVTLVSEQDERQFPTLFPILIRIAEYADNEAWKQEALSDFLPTYFERNECELPGMGEMLRAQLGRGGCIILLDGLDEIVSADDRRGIVRKIEDFVRSHAGVGNNKNHFIITSRIAGYRSAPVSPVSGDAFMHYVIEEMDETQMEHFLTRWCRAVEDAQTPDISIELRHATTQREIDGIMDAIYNNRGVKRLAGNPLMLRILALIHRTGARLPQKRVELYKLAADTLAHTWRLAQGLPESALIKERLLTKMLGGAFPKYVKSGRERGLRLLEKEERMSGEIKHENVPTTREKLRAKKKE